MLAWLLGETGGVEVRNALAAAELIVASDLTLVECDRVLIRAQTSGSLSEAHALSLRALLDNAAGHWNILRVDREVVERARRRFPGEPIRTLDLDRRIRASARALGLNVTPV